LLVRRQFPGRVLANPTLNFGTVRKTAKHESYYDVSFDKKRVKTLSASSEAETVAVVGPERGRAEGGGEGGGETADVFSAPLEALCLVCNTTAGQSLVSLCEASGSVDADATFAGPGLVRMLPLDSSREEAEKARRRQLGMTRDLDAQVQSYLVQYRNIFEEHKAVLEGADRVLTPEEEGSRITASLNVQSRIFDLESEGCSFLVILTFRL